MAGNDTSFVNYATPFQVEATLATTILEQYKEFQDIFEKNAHMLLEHRPYNCAIDLQEGTQPPFGLVYNLLQNKFLALKDYINENLAKSFIRHLKISKRCICPFYKEKKRILKNVCGLLGLKQDNNKELLSIVISIKTFGATWSN